MNLLIGAQTCSDVDDGSQREWLVCDGLGGYAMGTITGLRTRRYHGLLVVPVAGTDTRKLALASLDPIVVVGDERIALATHEWGDGTIAPRGHQLRSQFRLRDGLPSWRWSLGAIVIEAEIAMVNARAAMGMVWRCLAADRPITIEIEALCTWRDIHAETDSRLDPAVAHDADGFVFADAYRVTGPGWQAGGSWYRNVHHRQERARGLTSNEDLWCAGRFSAPLAGGQEMAVQAWALGGGDDRPPPASTIITDAHRRAKRLVASARPVDDVDADLVLAADQFVVSGNDVVAGYPWFSHWSRDTLISHRGLFLETGRADEGRRVLERMASTLEGGLHANTSIDGERHDNAADAPLWFIVAVRNHVDATGDDDLVAELLTPLTSIIDAYRGGTRFGIGVDVSGLVRIGSDDEALTWMDARVDGLPVTERRGCPVEINSLWISALRSLVACRRRLGLDDAGLDAIADAAQRSFSRFALGSGGLADVITPSGNLDRSLRPNQLLAASLPDGPLDPGDIAQVLSACATLFTPLGVRTLGPTDPSYNGRHCGDAITRDRAYHQGTAWPWLAGPFIDAIRGGRSDDPRVVSARRVATAMTTDLVAHLGDWGLGSISETIEGDAPHCATGCPFQAWSVAEVLRARRELLRSSP